MLDIYTLKMALIDDAEKRSYSFLSVFFLLRLERDDILCFYIDTFFNP